MPDDDKFNGLLSDYVAPISDDGFSDVMMAQIDTENAKAAAKLALTRRLALYGAGFAGGIIAALQLPKLAKLMPEMGVSVPNLSEGVSLTEVSTITLPINPILMVVAVLIGFVLWAALDQRSAELF